MLADPVQRFGGDIVPRADGEAGFHENGTGFVLGKQKAGLATFGPRHRKVELRFGVRCQYIIKGKLTAGPQHAPELTVDSLSIGNIHDYMLGPHDVETAVWKSQSQKVTGLIADQGAQTRSLRQQLGYGNKRRRKVYADNATAVGASEIARWASQT